MAYSYLSKICGRPLKETGLLGCKARDTPIDPNHKLGKALEGDKVDKGVYQGWLES